VIASWKLLCLSIFGVVFIWGIIPPEEPWFIGIGLAGSILTLIAKD